MKYRGGNIHTDFGKSVPEALDKAIMGKYRGRISLHTSSWQSSQSARFLRHPVFQRISCTAGIRDSQIIVLLSRWMSSAKCSSQLPGHTGQNAVDNQSTSFVNIEIVTTLQASRRALEKARHPNHAARPLHPLVRIKVDPSAWRPKLGLTPSVANFDPTFESIAAINLRTSPFSSIFPSCARTGLASKDDEVASVALKESGSLSLEIRQPRRRKMDVRLKEARASASARRIGGIALVDEICKLVKQANNWHKIREMEASLDTYYVGEVLKRQDDALLALSFFHWMGRLKGYRHNSFTYHIMIRILTRARKFDLALRLVDELHKTGYKPDVVTYTILISGFGAANQLQAALDIWKIMREVGCSPNVFTYNILINIHSRAGLYQEAKKLFYQMQEEGIRANTPTYCSMLNCLGKSGDLDAAKKLFEEMKESGCTPDVVAYTTIIDLHSKAGLYQKSVEFYREMLMAGLKPDIIILCAVMDCLGKAGDVLGARQVFEDLKKEGYRPDVVAYTNIIDIHAKSGFQEQAVQLCNEMREMGVQPNTVNYNAMLDCLGKAGNVSAAYSLFQEMKTRGCLPDLKTYCIMMCMHARLGLKDKCVDLLGELQRAGLQPNPTVLVAMIDCLGKVGNFQDAISMFFEIKAQGYPLDVVCYTRMIDICAKSGYYKEAMEVYAELQVAGLVPSVFTYNALIHCLGKSGNLFAAQGLFSEMRQRGCNPNIVTYNTMMALFSKAGKPELCLEVFTGLEAEGIQPDSVTFVTLMEALSRAGHPAEAENIFRKMIEAGHPARCLAYNILIDAWGKAGHLEKMDHWHKELVRSGMPPDDVTMTSLLVAYLRAHQYALAQQTVEALFAGNGTSRDCNVAAILLQHCSALEHQDHIDSVLSLMKGLECPPLSFAQKLLSSTADEEGIQGDCKRFFDSLQDERQESKLMFLDALIWFLHSQNRVLEAGCVWDYAVTNTLYSKAISVRYSPRHWAIDLHGMSVGTATVALKRTLSSFKNMVVRDNNVPEHVTIITGWGRGSKVPGVSMVKQSVQDMLEALRSPFVVDETNMGCFVCNGVLFVNWVKQFCESPPG